MKSTILLILIIFSSLIKSNECKAQVSAQDSLALVDFYNSTGGANWTNIHWDFNDYVEYWQGVSVDRANNRVIEIRLENQNISGAIPASFGNLTELTILDLGSNKITALPSSLGSLVNLTHANFHDNLLTSPIPNTVENLINLIDLDLGKNLFTGEIPAYFAKASNLERIFLGENDFTGNIPEYFGEMTNLTTLYLLSNKLSGHIPVGLSSNNKPWVGGMYLEISKCEFTFADIEPFAQIIHDKFDTSAAHYAFIYSQQAPIPITFDTATLAVSPGGTFENNTIKWYKNSILIATNIGDTTFAPDAAGLYSAEITNSVAADLTLLSDSIFVNFQLAEKSISTLLNISGTSAVDINKGIIKIVTVTPTAGANALSGDVTASVAIDPAVKTFNSQPYVQRHYDISPSINAANAQAIVTLYFTQQDFDNYNNYVTSNGLDYPLLPSRVADNGNVRITQFHGTFKTSPDPENYAGKKVMITPKATWDAANKWWTLSFPVSGFSGFFVSTGNSALPLSLIKFHGSLQEGSVALQWLTENETFTKEFFVERSNDGKTFYDIGSVSAQSKAGKNVYNFEDVNPYSGNNYYRLKMVDKDIHSSYSNIIKLNFQQLSSLLTIYPNPALNTLNLKFNLNKSEIINLQITDASGRLVEKRMVQAKSGITTTSINIEKLSKGLYFLETEINRVKERTSFVKN